MVAETTHIPPATDRLLDRAAQMVRRSTFAVALTGAGISAESGIPTFRGDEGLWKDFDYQEFATLEGFKSNPEKVTQWYNQRREELKSAKPNPAHHALAELEKLLRELLLITQNIDGLHQAAGAGDVIEIHGNIWFDKCLGCGYSRSVRGTDAPPPCRCPHCGNWLRPDVVWFGEPLPQSDFSAALEAADRCDLMLSVGTSATVQPAASLIWEAKASGATIIEINPQQTDATSIADVRLGGPAAQILPELTRRVKQ